MCLLIVEIFGQDVDKRQQKYFVEKYKEIYDDIGANNRQVKILDEKNDIVKYQISIDTVAGIIEYKNKIGIDVYKRQK